MEIQKKKFNHQEALGKEIRYLLIFSFYIFISLGKMIVNKILHNFCVMSGQLVNSHKSLVQFLNNIQGAMKRRLVEALNISMSNGISKYLGCQIIQGMIKRRTFSKVILKSQKKLASWKTRFL